MFNILPTLADFTDFVFPNIYHVKNFALEVTNMDSHISLCNCKKSKCNEDCVLSLSIAKNGCNPENVLFRG